MLKIAVLLVLFTLFAGFTAFVYTKGTETPANVPPLSSSASRGKFLYQKYNCTACHQLYGLGGYLGPELTTAVSQKGENYTRAILASGTQRMPDFELTAEEISDLIAFLNYVERTAITD